MATDLKVQFFSHLNGLALGNNWGDLIRLLDNCLVNGLALPSVTAASIDANGDINLTFFAAHNAVLFQIVELSSFPSVSVDGVTTLVNGKYRIKGAPTTTQLILKGNIVRTVENPPTVTFSNFGSAKLAPLGYDIIYRDTNDVKRVYRAKNPSSAHPFIRVDETISDGTNTYNSAYAKSAMIGLIENMTHIDDYQDPSKLQLPLDTTDFLKNWKITGTSTTVVRGWYKWYFATNQGTQIREADSIPAGNRRFTLIGNSDAFYLLNSHANSVGKRLNGCGLYKNSLNNDVVPNWFLMSNLANQNAAAYLPSTTSGFYPLFRNDTSSRFITTKYDLINRISGHIDAIPILIDFNSGGSGVFAQTNLPALEIPFYDSGQYLRGSLDHVFYAGKNISGSTVTTPIISNKSMYVSDSTYRDANESIIGGLYFYLGELE
ncbi:hypothetical protein NCZ17_06620 [Acinetobacter modestus]|uniref:hypothetical protein n=1 Tax=Acinetobacter modestus TaxID=1776740 RepID=UPI00202F4F3D|nr:hypothetical protein [Acinetobacter modestus]MCM1959044.1 hypothetical protein [Acinetobacter modestus]